MLWDHLNAYLMCPPEFFQVDYVINPWMEGNIDRANGPMAAEQWHRLHAILAGQGNVDLITPLAGSPDMVFTANAGLVLGDDAVLSRFLHPERQSEEPHFRNWFQQNGFRVHELPKDLPFEGAGDALFDRVRPLLWAGYGFRTELDTHALIAELLGIEVSVCGSSISASIISIPVSARSREAFCCTIRRLSTPDPTPRSNTGFRRKNVLSSTKQTLSISPLTRSISATLSFSIARAMRSRSRLSAAGFQVFEAPLTEFIKSGGAARCLTLRLNELPKPGARAHSEIASRVLRLEGHLLDSGLLDRALELTVQNGGSFQILNFQLGKQRQSTSRSEIRVSAPAADVLGNLVGQLIELGSIPAAAERTSDARLETVTMDGVAPDDFYVTTIYPTEVRLNGRWVRITGQRMDGCIVIDDSGPVEPTATVRLMRDLRRGDRVVVGIDGIQTVRKSESREERGIGGAPAAEFAFMGAGVSSERKIELVVREIAWELERIRERGGKVVVVAGPVVIHTGASEHLAALIRAGFVQVVLGGNGMAVHDIEQALLGTSLGVDMNRGTQVHGGHRHHLRAINTIRRCGSIAAAVEQGVLKSGIFYECVRAGVPFSLAASIRDDGPLPGVFTDMIEAQRDYARLIAGAEMILMLSSMLHSIGVGNMTPAGVKLVCVDINPAVVTKLADRGSIESIGVVTDVGLFLSLLVQHVSL